MSYHGTSIQWEAGTEVQQRVLQVLSNELFIKPQLSLLRRHPLNCEESKWRRAYALPWIHKREELRIPHKDRLPIPHPRILLLSQAFRVPNIQPSLWPLPTFRHSIPCPPISTTDFVEDEEIDFGRVLREKITLPKPVSWTAHRLTVDVVQPLISENLPATTKDTGGRIFDFEICCRPTFYVRP